ncbi:putative psbP domain-containing protein 5, chloroplastic-like [Capsicum annuum]|nr:putative psbP domain-containing protein 5, chloroplastic-like [Capsicum annuum]KAF3678700.1 putative psbP domain-containing protein 5, chloroplastic-like [Capsicum annuum]
MITVGGVYGAERLNRILAANWKSFARQNYFDSHGIFLSTLWSGPLLVIAIIVLVNTLFSLCYLIVRWKKAELRHRARLLLKRRIEKHIAALLRLKSEPITYAIVIPSASASGIGTTASDSSAG